MPHFNQLPEGCISYSYSAIRRHSLRHCTLFQVYNCYGVLWATSEREIYIQNVVWKLEDIFKAFHRALPIISTPWVLHIRFNN